MKQSHGDFNSEDQFLNMVIEVETELTPSGVLGAILNDRNLTWKNQEMKNNIHRE